MMYSFSLIIIAATLDIIANLLMEKSKGFKRKRFGVPALVLVCIAFTLLAKVTQFMDLAVS